MKIMKGMGPSGPPEYPGPGPHLPHGLGAPTSNTHTEGANTLLAFIISSLCKKWSTVVRLYLVQNHLLLKYYLFLRSGQRCRSFNLQIQVICTNNYPLIVNLFELLPPFRKPVFPTHYNFPDHSYSSSTLLTFQKK